MKNQKKTIGMHKNKIYFGTLFISLCVVIIISYNTISDLQKINNSLSITNTMLTSVSKEKEFKLKEKDEQIKEKDEQLKTLNNKISENSFIIINKDSLLFDMSKRFTSFSEKTIKIIVDTIIEESEKYKINPVVLYSLGIVESSHRYWIEHDKVTLFIPNEDGKKEKINTQAVGWGGVIWEWHHKLLKEKGIADSRSDLFYPDVNIRATAAIYNMYYNMPLKEGVKNPNISAQRRYFGGNHKEYSDRIDKQVVALIKSEMYRSVEDEDEEYEEDDTETDEIEEVMKLKNMN